MTLTAQQSSLVRDFINRSYSWMAAGLVLTAAIAYITSQNLALLSTIASLGWLLILVQFGIVAALSFLSQRVNSAMAGILFMVYAAITGLIFSGLLAFNMPAVISAFGVSALSFGALSVYGMTTKRDLTAVGRFAFFALIGLILASIANIFVGGNTMSLIISGAGVLIFGALTAYDTQKLREMALMGLQGEQAEKGAIYGALELYLDFINIFLFLFRIFNSRD